MRIDNNHKDIHTNHTNGNHTNDFISAIFYYEHINGFRYIKHFIRTKQYKQLLVVSRQFHEQQIFILLEEDDFIR